MPGALDGVRVLEFSMIVAGPVCGLTLADLGADVVKVEPPGGEPHRRNRSVVPGESKLFQNFNRGKRGLVVDLHTERGRELIYRLIPNFDVAVGSLSGFGPVPYKPQLKFTSRTQDVNLASGWEMKLIQAEAVLRGAEGGALQDAVDLINEVRTRNVSDNDGQPLAGVTAADATEAWTHLKRERRIELWLEGRAAPDERRWDDAGAPGTLDIPNWEDPSHPGYTTLFVENPRGNLCFDIPESERDRNPNIPSSGG